ncbi:thymidine phosphorylase [[Mycoplasma] testudinis]|uniref:thymidine phosphorylase n=1 Tax=[Mycoplasma] testudinis TaxID=33924 RepID=UPI00048539AD|nr:thymidine phosphorylase [[Mycoplasma] testudinis]
MNFIDLIELKKHKKVLSEKQWQFFVDGVVSQTLPDYQISAFLMAIWFNGMTINELYFLTNAMLHSGKIISFKDVYQKILVDKHSTGGIGDKVTIALAPILACFDLGVAKLSGRGLGFTGGTIDKLEALKIDTNISVEQAKKILVQNDMFVMGQTDFIAPADKFLYALRDVTATTDSLPLIAASILSKKFALETDHVFLDIKYGEGAFCRTKKIAQELGELMLKLAKKFKRKVDYELSDMSHVLGRSIGNAIEFKEAADYLQNKSTVGTDFKTLMERIVVNILVKTKRFKTEQTAKEQLNKVLKSKQAFNQLCKWVACQGGDADKLVKDIYFKPKYKAEIKALQSGIVNYYSPVDLAELGIDLGAGRKVKGQPLDFQAGIYLNVKDNEKVKKNNPVFTLYCSKPISSVLVKKASTMFKIS